MRLVPGTPAACAVSSSRSSEDRRRQAADSPSNADVTIEDIWHERRVELALEGHRFFDLVRQGRAAEVMQAHLDEHFPGAGYSFVAGVNELFPIPSNEITLSGGLITQNPGY